MRVQIAQPVASAQQLQGFFQSTLPRYEHFSRGGSAVVGAGLMVGVVVKPDGPNAVSLGWEIPNLGVKLLMVLSIFAGILPGLLLWGLVWMVISGDVERLKQEIAQALTTGTVQAGGPMAPMQSIPSRPGRPGGVALAFGMVFTLMALGAFAYAAYMLDRAGSADRQASYSASRSYGSGYRSVLGPDFWYSIARRRREEAYASAGGGVVNLLIAVGLFALRRSKVRAWESDPANAAPMGMMPQQGYGPPMGMPQQGYGPPQQGYGPPMGAPQQGYGPPQQGYGPPMGAPQQGYNQPQSGPNPYGAPQQGGWPPPGGGGGGGYPPGGQGPAQG
ncbi:MAG: hypothetical protein Q8S73_00615 [Deltaproteobacteria bacterium]|nr:hypothetical protein [Myxococcales bacterium]MDP3212575.1 hypothetical protein [Deltaproteobacteria bacterium]